MNEERRYLVKNQYQWTCKRCFKTHEFLTTCCVPILFKRPEDLMLVKRWREQVGERTHDLNIDALPLGTIIEVTPREAQQIASRLAATGDGPSPLSRTIFA